MAVSFVSVIASAQQAGLDAITPATPADMVDGDLCIVAAMSLIAPTMPSPWVRVGYATASEAALSIFYNFAPFTMPAVSGQWPVCATAMAFRGVDPDAPIDDFEFLGSNAKSLTNIVTTTDAEHIVFALAGRDVNNGSVSAWGNLTDTVDYGRRNWTYTSSDGSICTARGVMASAGAVGTLTWTYPTNCSVGAVALKAAAAVRRHRALVIS